MKLTFHSILRKEFLFRVKRTQINRTLKDVDRFRTHSDENINNNKIYINLPRIYIFLIINWNIIKKLEIYDKVLKKKPLLEKSIPIMNCCFI